MTDVSIWLYNKCFDNQVEPQQNQIIDKDRSLMIPKNLLINSDPNIENQNILHINRLPARSTVVPAQKRGVYYQNKYQSSLIRSLNGNYKFKYLTSDTFRNFYSIDINDSDWDTIDVPSMWQYRGYGKPEYPNIRYSIPFSPPYVKKQNPVGLYRKSFHVDQPSERTILHFAGVDNAFYVYLNGVEIGFSKGSRMPAEFDITKNIKAGKNLIAVKVFTYSDATYLENQDMLLASGIFRDVFLIQTRENTLWDYRVTTTYSSISVEARLNIALPYKVRITLGGQVAEYDAKETVNHTFKLKDAKLWTAETPNLYDLNIELIDKCGAFEIHSKRIGIMHTRVSGNKLLINEKPIYIKGINRHENDPWNGKALTVEQIRRDLEIIKTNNLNAVRMAHYPNDPTTYEIAAEIGLYLMDEADLETHGAHVFNEDQGFLSKSPEWLDAYKDRIIRMLERDKNEVAVFIWSTGNEAGTGDNLNKCIDLIREFDPSRECIITQDTGEYTHFRKIGYYPISKTEEYSDEGYPVLAIEYAHAMGNSPGALQEYWDYNYTHEKMLGGFAWEFRSHGFGARDEHGNIYMKYGGDFDDDYHWSNFNMDGFCLSDGIPKPTWYELGTVSFAAYTVFDGEQLTIKNTNDFLDLSYLKAELEIECDGVVSKNIPISLPKILPHDSFTFTPDLSIEKKISGARYYLNVLYFKDGVQVHKKQFELGTLLQSKPYLTGKSKAQIAVNDYLLTVEYGDVCCSFTKGMLSFLKSGKKILLDEPMKLNMHRAYIDNDGIFGLGFLRRHIREWQDALIHKYYFNLFDIDVEENEDRVVVSVDGRYTANSLYAGFFIKIIYEILSNGTILITLKGEPYGALPSVLPRIGVVFEINHKYEMIKWLGRGPYENYADSIANAPVGIYERNISELNTDYDYPQETGNHEQVYALTVHTKNNKFGLSVIGSDTFSFSYHNVSLDCLTNARHKNELTKSDKNYLYVDYKMRGLGSRSCGPEPEEKYDLHPHKFTFTFAIKASDFDRAVSDSQLDFGKKTEALSDAYVYIKPEKIKQIADCDI